MLNLLVDSAMCERLLRRQLLRNEWLVGYVRRIWPWEVRAVKTVVLVNAFPAHSTESSHLYLRTALDGLFEGAGHCRWEWCRRCLGGSRTATVSCRVVYEAGIWIGSV